MNREYKYIKCLGCVNRGHRIKGCILTVDLSKPETECVISGKFKTSSMEDQEFIVANFRITDSHCFVKLIGTKYVKFLTEDEYIGEML